MCVQNRRFQNLNDKLLNQNEIADNTGLAADNAFLGPLTNENDNMRLASDTRAGNSVETADQRVEYLEKKLLKSLKNWLAARGFWLLLRNSIKFVGLGSDNGGSARLLEMNLNEGDEFGRKRLIKVLKFTKQFNACMFLCHSILLLNAIIYGSWQHYQQASNLIFPTTSTSSPTSTSISTSTRSSFADVMLRGESTTSASYLSSSALFVANLPTGGYIGFHLLWVTILDFLNNLYWYHSKETIASGRQEHTWLKSVLHILTSPRHLFQATYVCLFLGVGPLSGLGILLSPFNSITQILRHCYNWYRIQRYLRMLKPAEGQSAPGHNNNSNNNNELNTTTSGDASRLRTYMEREIDHDDNNNNDNNENDNEGNNGNETSESALLSTARGIQSELCNEEPGWPRYSGRHQAERRGRGSESLGTLTMHRFERLHMMSQLLGVKLTIFTLVLHIDALNSRRSLESLISLACLVEAFLAMYSYYDKYYSRYMDRRGHLLRRASLLVMQLRQRQQLQRLHSRVMAASHDSRP